MAIEIICCTKEDIIQMNELPKGFEIELCNNLEKGGYTPDIDLIAECVNISKHPIRVMIRNHDNGFYYEKEELKIMVNQINEIKDKCQPTGFVFGCLNKEGNDIDEEALKILSGETLGYSNTFHKAIDLIIDTNFIPTLKKYNIDRILTQGGIKNIDENIEKLIILNKQIKIIAGGGINEKNVNEIKKGVKNMHLGRLARKKGCYEQEIDLLYLKKTLLNWHSNQIIL